jgi:DNA-binding MarR family transcriptional regulator
MLLKYLKEKQVLSKVRILSLLHCQADLDALALSEQVGCTQPAASMALLRLVRQGLLNRAWDPQERRFFYYLTPKGRLRWAHYSRTHAHTKTGGSDHNAA